MKNILYIIVKSYIYMNFRRHGTLSFFSSLFFKFHFIRFGKFIQVYFNNKQKIVGCQIENYLLEKSRVVMQLEGERNFHIFYMLCTAPTVKVRSELRLEQPNDYYYLDQSGCVVADGIDDVSEIYMFFHFIC